LPSYLQRPSGYVCEFDGHIATINSLAWSSDGRLLSGSGNRQLRNVTDLTLEDSIPVDCTMRLWDASTGKEILVLAGHKDIVTTVAFSPDNRHGLSGSRDRTLKMWDLLTGKEAACLEGHSDSVTVARFLFKGRQIVSGSLDGTIRIWDTQTSREIRRIVLDSTGGIRSLAISPDDRLVLAGMPGRLVVLDTSNWQDLNMFSTSMWSNEAVAVSPDNTSAACCDGKVVRVVSLKDGSILSTLSGHTKGATCLAFAPDGRRIVVGSRDGIVRVWDLEQKRLVGGHYKPDPGLWATQILCVCVSPDGDYVVSAGNGKSIRMWKLLR
jgi:WD40 repeat protein